MPSHKKTPAFIRVVTNEKKVVCINPLQLSSFEILEKAQIKVKNPDGGEPVIKEADTIRFYFPAGTSLTYSVGMQISREEYNYICNTLLEFLYLNEQEFEAKSKAIATAKMSEWNQISEENSQKVTTPTTEA